MKKGFTLAEILITLGIIGVVAAMTMPTLIQKQQDKEAVVKVKRAYNILSNAYAHFSIENNVKNIDTSFSEEGATNVFKIFEPYLHIAKDCGTTDTTCNTAYTNQNYYKILLNDGTGLIFRGRDSSTYSNKDNPELNYGFSHSFQIFVDINGPKSPNRWGYDIFEFDEHGGKIVPCGAPSVAGMPVFEHHCAKKNSSHYACAAWIVLNENRDYLHCEDLSWNGKKKCK